MAFLENYIGDVLAVYTPAQYVAGQTPRLGDWFFDHKTHKKYIFLRNKGSSAITASLVATSLTTSRAYAPTAADTTAFQSATPACELAAATANLPFAGVRDVGATSMAQHECGWFAIAGGITITADATGTTAEKVCVTSDATAGNIEVISSTYAVAMGPGTMIGVARTTTAGAVAVVDVTSNIWGL